MSNNLLVLQSDFGLVDGAVSAMIGVALQESADLIVLLTLTLFWRNQGRFYNPWK